MPDLSRSTLGLSVCTPGGGWEFPQPLTVGGIGDTGKCEPSGMGAGTWNLSPL